MERLKNIITMHFMTGFKVSLSRCVRSAVNPVKLLMPVLAVMLWSGSVYAADNSAASCNKSCSVANECKPSVTNASTGRDHQIAGLASRKINTKCVKSLGESSCFNGYPMSSSATGNYNAIGYRPNGAGGNSTPRNHYGSDLGTGGLTNVKALAPADGEIVYTNWHNGSGRTMVMEFAKKCEGPGGGGKFHTVFRHLYQYGASGKVKKNDVVGIVGGSNKTGSNLCDNPAQQRNCSKGYYDIHLHIEVVNAPFSSSSGTLAHTSTIMQPYCQNLGVLCGDCQRTDEETMCDDGKGSSSPVGNYAQDGGAPPASDEPDYTPSKCSYGDYLDTSSCLFCDLFKIMFNAASSIALLANNALRGPTMSLVKIGFLIWLAVYLLKQLATFGGTESGEMAKGILFQGFRVAAVTLILSSMTSLFYVMDITLNPVMMTGLNFVQNLNEHSTCNKDADYMQGIRGYSSEKGYANSTNPNGGLSTELGEAIVCNIKNLEDATGVLMALGNFSICLSFNDFPWVASAGLPHLGYLTTGIFLWLAGVGLLVTFPWCLIDCILQLCISAALIPCAIGAYAFKSTAKYLKIIWSFFMNAMFNFVFMAIIIYIINQQLSSWLGLNISASDSKEEMGMFFTPDTDPQVFIRFNGLAWYGLGFFRVAAVCFFCYVFFDEAKSMAQRFADSPGLGGSHGIGKMVGGTVADASRVAGKYTAQAAGKAASAAGAGVNYLAGNAYRNARNHAMGFVASRMGKNGAVTLDENGKTVAHEGNIRIFGRDIKMSATKGEDGKWTMTREIHKRSQSDKAFEKVLDKDGNEVKDANGNTVYRARHRIMGKVTGYEEMTATKDKDGNLVYSTADGKSQFIMGQDGQIAAYKTRFTRGMKGRLKQYGTNRIVNTATSKTIERLDTKGNVVSSQTKMQDFNLFNRDLVRKDGTINLDTFNELQKNASSAENAAQALVTQVMEKRGIPLSSEYNDRKVTINDDGSMTLQQVNKDGSTQNINAVMIGKQMFISVETTDKDGNITVNKSNGIRSQVESIRRQKDGTLNYDYKASFSEYAMSRNSTMQPLNHKGQWGNNIDRDKAMAGFTQQDFDKHLAQLQVKQMSRTMSPGAYDNSAEASEKYSMVHAGNISSMEEAKSHLSGAKGSKTQTYNINPDGNRDKSGNDKLNGGEKPDDIETRRQETQDIRDELANEQKKRDAEEQKKKREEELDGL